MLFCKGDVSQLHLWKPCMILGVPYFPFRRVNLAEYIPVLRVYFPPVADDMLYQGFCKTCLHLAGDED
jgi:hypothetical protein